MDRINHLYIYGAVILAITLYAGDKHIISLVAHVKARKNALCSEETRLNLGDQTIENSAVN